MPVEGSLSAPSEIENLSGDTKLRLFEACRGDTLSKRHVENINDVHRKAERDVDSPTSDRERCHRISNRIVEQARLDDVRLRHVQVGVERAEIAILEQR